MYYFEPSLAKMKKQIVFVLITFMFVISGLAQNCLPDGIIFSSQQQVDSFQINYPGCRIIEGTVEIVGTVNNLNGLLGLEEIQGSLLVGGYGGIPIEDLSGLDSLTTIGSILYISNCYSLNNLNNLNKLQNIGSGLSLYRLWDLNDLHGLELITSIGGGLSINDCGLANLAGLQNLEHIGGSLHLENLRQIPNLDSLKNLSTISGSLKLIYTTLSDISALQYIPAESISNLTLDWNEYLSYCHLPNICDYLSDPNGIVLIKDNGEGCNTQEEVENNCLVGLPDEGEEIETIEIYFIPSSNEIVIISGTNTVLEILVHDQLGQLLLRNKADSKSINISPFPSGAYIVSVLTNNSKKSKLIVKY